MEYQFILFHSRLASSNFIFPSPYLARGHVSVERSPLEQSGTEFFSANITKEAKEEILIVSIGEPVTDEIKLANRDALERGVSIKFIVHKYNQENYGLLRSWIKMGIEVRYFAESGYHLVVIDGKKCLLTTSNPQNSQERTSVVIYGEGLSKAMQQYFYTLWEKSLAIKATS